MDLAEFVQERLREDEAAAKAAAAHLRWQTEDADFIAGFRPERILREAAAKRAILEAHGIFEPGQYAGYPQFSSCSACGAAGFGESYEVSWPCPTLRHLAAVWPDHPDYQPDWKPC